ncbi:MAG TPA: thioredoxin domain-containing protein [Bryobacteraceae bacterium]|nr:thioredoxin domain-containing protein [Bryobacteraceae bacterium]
MKLAIVAFSVMSIAASGAVEGNAASPVRVISFESLQCGDCAVYRNMLDRDLLPKYGARVAFEHRDFPLPKHAWSRPAAIAARHFDKVQPSLGLNFRRWALTNIASITAENFEAQLRAWAEKNGQSADAAVKALSNPELGRAVTEDLQDGVARGISRTPTVLVNGQPFIERFTAEELSAAIDAALAEIRK